jgi:hypothetical protein
MGMKPMRHGMTKTVYEELKTCVGKQLPCGSSIIITTPYNRNVSINTKALNLFTVYYITLCELITITASNLKRK